MASFDGGAMTSEAGALGVRSPALLDESIETRSRPSKARDPWSVRYGHASIDSLADIALTALRGPSTSTLATSAA
jgi:hypothetical protein